MLRLVAWAVVISLLLALLRLATILAVIAFGIWLLWALVNHPRTTVAALVLFAAISIAKAQPAFAAALFILGLVVWRTDLPPEH